MPVSDCDIAVRRWPGVLTMIYKGPYGPTGLNKASGKAMGIEHYLVVAMRLAARLNHVPWLISKYL